MRGPVYCIDTSSLIDLHRYYPRQRFPTLWDRLELLISEERLIAPREVRRELEAREDELTVWVREHRVMFIDPDLAQTEAVTEIQEQFQGLLDPDKEGPEADPWVVALPVSRARTQGLVQTEWVVVTQERGRGPQSPRPRIPDVCGHYGLRSINLLELVRQEGWTF